MRYTTIVDTFDIRKDDLELYISKKSRKDIDYKYECDDIFTFDIEVTSGWKDKNGNIVQYVKGMSDSYWQSLEPIALPYLWQFSFNDFCYVGRDIRDFEKMLNKIPEDVHVIIYVHNLSYEFHFLCNLFEDWLKVFARARHKPMYAIPDKYPNIEFRCSYLLTRLSLEEWGKELGCNKLHTLDYTILRTPLTSMKEEEIEYGVRDCEVVYKGIKKFKEQYGHIERIPLTQTGCVRRDLKELVRKDKRVRNLLQKIVPSSYIYGVLKNVFAGGYTHSNCTLTGFNLSEIFTNGGNQYDIASSYPFVMVSEKFPMTPFVEEIFEPDRTDDYAYLLRVHLYGVNQKYNNHYLSYSKTEETINETLDNGRLISADYIDMWCTEVDYELIQETYKIEKTEIVECYRSRKAYLPELYINFILNLYAKKTTLKGVEDKIAIYMKAKRDINCIFGMSVTDIIQMDIDYKYGEWKEDAPTEEDIYFELERLSEFDKNCHNYIAYQWGPWITAYARKNLWTALIPNDEITAYCDTDSLKVGGDVDFEWYNDLMDEKLRKMCEATGIDFERTRPKTPKGVSKPLGHLEKEEPWSEFVTLGAKRYCYRSKKDGKLHSTISGINKDAVECLHDDISNFKDGFLFDKDAIAINTDGKEYDCVRKKFLTYREKGKEMPKLVWNKGQYDEYESDLKYGINMRPMGYLLELEDHYAELLDLNKMIATFNETPVV